MANLKHGTAVASPPRQPLTGRLARSLTFAGKARIQYDGGPQSPARLRAARWRDAQIMDSGLCHPRRRRAPNNDRRLSYLVSRRGS
jgi:hypothetical protein